MKHRKINYILFLIVVLSSILMFGVGDASWQIALSLENNILKINPVCYNLTKSTYFTSIEKALSTAVSGDILYLIPGELANYSTDNKETPPDKVEYTIKKDCEIKSGVTLILPTDKSTLSTVTNSSTLNTFVTNMYSAAKENTSTSYATKNSTNYLRCTLNIADGVTLINNGTLIISGYLSAGNSNPCMLGHTAYSYAQIKLGSNSKIIQDNSSAITYCLGYIFENSTNNQSNFKINKGTLYVPFIIDDYRGFSFSWAMTDGAIDNQRCSAFNQFELRNIDTLTTILYGVSVISYVNVLVKYETMKINQVFTKEINLVGTSSSDFIQLTDSNYSYIDYKFDTSSSHATINIYGGLTLNTIELTLSSAAKVDLSTSNAYFPLSYRMNVNLFQNTKQDTIAIFNLTNQRIKLLPGSKMTINENCSVTANEIIVYSGFYDGTRGNGRSSINGYNSVSYPIKEGGILKLNDTASLTSTYLSGTIYKSDTANVFYTDNIITSKEAWQIGSSGKLSPAWTITDYLEIREQLQLVSLSYINKVKLYVVLNTFTNYNSNLIVMNVNINTQIYTIDSYQKVIFEDSINTYTLSLLKNIYLIKYGTNGVYENNSTITYSTSSQILCAINSTQQIVDNSALGGINEFEAQSISLTCETPMVNDKIPLYIDSTILLSATVDDITKIYDKTITWWSSDENIAIVDQNGYVTGVALGKVQIYAKCNQVETMIELEVLESEQILPLDSITITDDKGNSSENSSTTHTDTGPSTFAFNGEYSNNTTVTFTVNTYPSDVAFSSITWEFTASAKGRQWINDNTLTNEVVKNEESIVVNIGSGTGTSDDKATLKVTVIDLKGNSFSKTFILNHKYDTS